MVLLELLPARDWFWLAFRAGPRIARFDSGTSWAACAWRRSTVILARWPASKRARTVCSCWAARKIIRSVCGICVWYECIHFSFVQISNHYLTLCRCVRCVDTKVIRTPQRTSFAVGLDRRRPSSLEDQRYIICIRKRLLMHCNTQDALVYMWDLETGSLISKLAGHEGTVYMAKWNQSQALLARYCDSRPEVPVSWFRRC